MEIADLADTLTEVNTLIEKRHIEEISVNRTYISDVMEYVLRNSDLILSDSFLSEYEYIFNVFTTPDRKTSYNSLEELQSEVDQIANEIAVKDSFKRGIQIQSHLMLLHKKNLMYWAISRVQSLRDL